MRRRGWWSMWGTEGKFSCTSGSSSALDVVVGVAAAVAYADQSVLMCDILDATSLLLLGCHGDCAAGRRRWSSG